MTQHNQTKELTTWFLIDGYGISPVGNISSLYFQRVQEHPISFKVDNSWIPNWTLDLNFPYDEISLSRGLEAM
jgi:hypothetical protein